jgi:uncharacterized peroxidase-related enzyme
MALIDYVDPENADEVDGRLTDLFDAEAEKYGRPTLFGRALANNPDVFAARVEYAGALIEGGDLDPTLKELAYVAVSQANDCEYCVASHAEHLVERVGVPAERIEAIANDDLDAFDDRERAVVSLARQMATDPKRVGEDHLDALYETGLGQSDVVELVTSVSAAVAANTIADALNVHPADRSEEFAEYAGREK